MLPGFVVSKCAILANTNEPSRIATIREAMDTLLDHLADLGMAAETYVNVPVKEIKPSDDVGIFIVLGGDGTMIHFAGRLGHYGIPFYGLNYGNVGFMMNNPHDGLDYHVKRIKAGEFIIREFPVLKVKAIDLQGHVHEGVGLNDIYLQRMTPQSCKVNIFLGNEPLGINPLLCDGVIVSTPLGSTAYNYNVTGSLASIDTTVISLTPVAAQRSCPVNCMMLPFDTQIRFDILEPEKRRVQVVSDGQSHGDLTRAEIRISSFKVKLCFGSEYSKNLPMRFINKACG